MTRLILVLAFLSGCAVSGPLDLGPDGSGFDDAATDGGADAATDAADDATEPDATDDGGATDAGPDVVEMDAEPDVIEPLPWKFYLDGDECDLLSQTQINGNPVPVTHYCRREYLGSGTFGAAKMFAREGNLFSNAATTCNASEAETDAAKKCKPNRFCIPGPGTCHLPCDPEGDPCPVTDIGGAAQECVVTDRFPQPYCRWADHL